MNKSILTQLWKRHNKHCNLASVAKEKGWPVALQYHQGMAQEYLDLINALTERKEVRGNNKKENEQTRASQIPTKSG